jgi:YD repeat-containing protein
MTYTFYDDRHRPTITLLDFDGDGAGVTAGTYVNDASTFGGDAQDFITRSVYDGAGHVRFTTDAENRTTESIYDGAGRVTESRSPALDIFASASRVVSGFVPTTHAAYDAAGNPVIATDANSNRTLTQYDARSRVIRTILDRDGDGVFEPGQGPTADDVVMGQRLRPGQATSPTRSTPTATAATPSTTGLIAPRSRAARRSRTASTATCWVARRQGPITTTTAT